MDASDNGRSSRLRTSADRSSTSERARGTGAGRETFTPGTGVREAIDEKIEGRSVVDSELLSHAPSLGVNTVIVVRLFEQVPYFVEARAPRF